MKKDLLSLLGASKDEQVFSHLLAALKDPKDEIREGAVLGLMALGDLRAKKSLQALLSDPSENVQNLVRSALHVL